MPRVCKRRGLANLGPKTPQVCEFYPKNWYKSDVSPGCREDTYTYAFYDTAISLVMSKNLFGAHLEEYIFYKREIDADGWEEPWEGYAKNY